MARRTVRRDRRNQQHGYDWTNLEYPWTSTGKAVTVGTVFKRISWYAEQIRGALPVIGDIFKDITESLMGLFPPDFDFDGPELMKALTEA
ncbi:hypothetical protein [Tsukamurella tyrosinosolvens]|uniref:hypothetical protein n=1 Tax=Tsukamurella tyrosinosolvens TaxID=57704 RepID=UPI003462D2C3